MKKLLTIAAFIILSCIFINNSMAQVYIKLHQPPPNKLGVADMWNLELDNTTGKDIKIYLTGTATEEKDGLIIDGKSKVFTLKPGKANYKYNDFSNAEIKYNNGKYKEIILRTGSAPEGSYTICVTAFDEDGNEVGRENCITQSVQLMGSITLLTPGNGEEVDPEQPIMFTWTPLPKAESYTLRIVELKGDQSPEIAMQQNRSFFEKEGIRAPNFQYSNFEPKFEIGKKYAWRVKAGETESEVYYFMFRSNIDMKLDSMKISCTDNPQVYDFDMWVQNTSTVNTIWKFHGIGIVTTIPPVTAPSFSGTLNPAVLQTSGLNPPTTGSISSIDVNPGQLHVFGSLNIPNTSFNKLVILHWYHQNSSFMVPGSYSAFDTVNFQSCGKNCCDRYFESVNNSTALYNGSQASIAPVFYSTAPIVKITADVVSCYKTISGPPNSCPPGNTPVYPKIINANMTSFSSALSYSGEAFLYNTAGVITNGSNPLNMDIMFGSPTSPPCEDKIIFCIRYTFTDIKCRSCDTVLCYQFVRSISGNIKEETPERFTEEEFTKEPQTVTAAGYMHEMPFVNAEIPVLNIQQDCPGIETNIVSSFIISPFDSACMRKVNNTGINFPGNNCLNACENSYVTYSTDNNAGSIYNWSVTGSVQSFSGQGTNSISVLWGAVGTGSVTVTETNNNCTETDNICIQIIETPIAGFNLSALNICLGQTVYFTNTSVNAVDYYWDFGDNTNSTDFAPNHTYSAAGTYTVTLIAYNQCGCLDSIQQQITVDPGSGPDINCPTTVCAGAEKTYYTNFNCSGASCYIWTVTGAVSWTQSSDGKSINVVWGAGPLGTITLEISSSCSCHPVCPHPTIVNIPIIPAVPQITGQQVVCAGEFETYSLPVFPGTYYTWDVTGGNIISGQNTNEIEVQWSSTNGTVKITLQNIILGCGGTNIINVKVKQEFNVSGPIEACVGSTNNYNAYTVGSSWPFPPCNWMVSSGGNITSGQGTATVNVTWNLPGPQTIYAVPVSTTTYCNNQVVINVNVLSIDPPVSITGPTTICPGTAYTYTAQAAPGGNPVIWSVTNGTIIGSPNANPVTVTWVTGGGTISVSHVSTTSPYCESVPISISVNSLNITAITGPSSACVDGTSVYTAGSPNPAIDYQWTVTPANIGSIILGQGTNQVTIRWNSDAVNPMPVNATVNLNVCGSTLNLTPVTVNRIEPTVSVSTNNCITTLSTQSFSSYQWFDGNNTPIGNSQSIQITQSGTYFLKVTDANGCTGENSIAASVPQAPTARIVSPGPNRYCAPVTNINTSLYAIVDPNAASYEWYFNGGGTSVGSGNSYVISNSSQFGDYTLKVTGVNGCSSTSIPYNVSEITCPIPSNCTAQSFSADFSFPTGTYCNTINFNIGTVTNFNPPYYWNFGDNSNGSGNNPSHTYSAADYYHVSVCSSVPSGICPQCVEHVVEIPIVADFDLLLSCNNVLLTDKTTYLPGVTLGAPIWEYKLSSGSTYLPATNLLTLPAGTYDIRLTSTKTSPAPSCTSEMVKQVTINSLPSISFIINPSPVCANNPVNFTGPAGMFSYKWNYGDNSESYTQNSDHTYTADGSFTVSLTVTSFDGCTQTVMQNITVNPMPNLSITPLGTVTYCTNNPSSICICEGFTQVLQAPAGNTYQWFDVNGAIVPAETSQNLTVNQSGSYYVEVTTLNNCIVKTDPVIVVVNPKPKAIITPSSDPNVCCWNASYPCSYITFTAFDGGGYEFSWLLDGGQPPGYMNQSIAFNIPSGGTHNLQLTVTDPVSGCTATETLPISNNQPPNTPYISITSSVPVCAGQNIDISVSIPNSSLTYLWSTGQTGNGITVTEAGTYYVTATNAAGCSTLSNSITINPNPDPSLFPAGCDSLCDTTNLPGPKAPTGYSYTYQWFLNGDAIPGTEGTQQELDLNPLPSGEYTLLIISSAGCSTLAGPYNIITHTCGENPPPPKICCRETRIDVQSSLSYVINDEHILNASFTYMPSNVKRVIAAILGAKISGSNCYMNGEQSAFFYSAQNISGNIASLSGPVMPVSYIYPREVIWGSNTGPDYDLSSTSSVKLGIKVPIFFWCTDNLTIDVKYSFLDTKCQICDTVITYTIPRRGKIKPWWRFNFKVLMGEDDPINKSLNSAREKLAGTDLGKKIEVWYGQLDNTDWAEKLLNDENKLDLAKKLVKIGRRVAVEGGTLEKEDLPVIEKSLKAIEEAGLPAPEGLIEKVMGVLKSSTGKSWNDLINNMSSEKKSDENDDNIIKEKKTNKDGKKK